MRKKLCRSGTVLTTMSVKRYLIAAFLILAAGTAMADDRHVLPVDPTPPTSVVICNALYAEYRRLIDGLRAEADACNGQRAQYVQERYGHLAGEGECARRIVEPCRPLVDQCTNVRAASLAALDRCHAAMSRD